MKKEDIRFGEPYWCHNLRHTKSHIGCGSSMVKKFVKKFIIAEGFSPDYRNAITVTSDNGQQYVVHVGDLTHPDKLEGDEPAMTIRFRGKKAQFDESCLMV